MVEGETILRSHQPAELGSIPSVLSASNRTMRQWPGVLSGRGILSLQKAGSGAKQGEYTWVP